MKYAYGLFRGNKWLLVTNLADARLIQKGRVMPDSGVAGGQLRRMLWRDFARIGWDAPTFIALSDPI